MAYLHRDGPLTPNQFSIGTTRGGKLFVHNNKATKYDAYSGKETKDTLSRTVNLDPAVSAADCTSLTQMASTLYSLIFFQ